LPIGRAVREALTDQTALQIRDEWTTCAKTEEEAAHTFSAEASALRGPASLHQRDAHELGTSGITVIASPGDLTRRHQIAG
jgi:hypothetical protein